MTYNVYFSIPPIDPATNQAFLPIHPSGLNGSLPMLASSQAPDLVEWRASVQHQQEPVTNEIIPVSFSDFGVGREARRADVQLGRGDA